MRFRTKLILIIVGILVMWMGFARGFESLKDRYLYKFIANRFRVYAERRWKADLYIGYVKGNILTNLSLKNIVIDNVNILPKEFQLKADSLDLTYPPLGLLYGELDSKFVGLYLACKDTEIPVDAYQHKDTAIVVIRRNALRLDQFRDSVPKDISLRGTITSEGEIVFKNLRPHMMNLFLSSKDFQIDYKNARKVRGVFNLEAAGRPANANIYGNVKIQRGEFIDGFLIFSLFKDLNFGNDFLDNATMDVDIEGRNINLSNQYLEARLNISCKLRKHNDEKPYLLGTAWITGGIFKVYSHQFRITYGRIGFISLDKEPVLDIIEVAHIGRHKITAEIKGGKDRYFNLSSQPELPLHDIFSLLRFGKYNKDLTDSEKEELTETNFSDILISNLFSG
ncbi:MAG: translocation/assembly module TamB [Candidatus Omnitrophica bacterium]|nr:translocation/assembly module TamB [Candidatus Omnitrophota bacterium]MBU4487523.1 translocation/assembly module TamB [Candidatus Omnitrophota bacterium]